MIEQFLIDNRDYYRELYNDFELPIRKLLKSEFDPVFHKDVDKQRDEGFLTILVDDISNRLAIDTESVIIVLETMNVKEYLK